MTGNDGSRAGLTRRSFLKTAGATVGALGIAGAAGMTATSDWLAPTQAYAEPEERVAYTTHQSHCSGHCSLKCTVRDGRLVHIEPNQSWAEKRLATCCLKGLSEVQHVYSSERIQSPLKRTGERGSGEFTAITWDEALSEIAEKLLEVKERYGAQSILVKRAKEANYSLLTNALGALTDRNTGIDTGIGNGMDPATGIGGGFASGSNEDRDWLNSKTIIHMGNNFLESSLVTASTFFDAKEAGAHIICIDPIYSTTAGKCHEWIPIEPGTDAALLLGMVTAVLENNWYDTGFAKSYTSFPYLVDAETGLLLRGGEESGGKGFYVWDEGLSAAVPHTSASDSTALEGSFEVEGRKVKTVFSLLKDSQQDYSISWASGVTGISEEVILYLADRYANGGPASLSLGYGGGDKYSNADVVGHAAIVLASLVGQIGKPGSSVGIFGGGTGVPSASLASWSLPKEFMASKQEKGVFEQRGTSEIKALFAPCDMILQSFANMSHTEEWLKSLELVVVAEIYATTMAEWADYVLPVCSRFECEDDIASVSTGQGHIRLQEKVLDPLFQSRSDFYIEKELMERLGLGTLTPSSRFEYAEYQLSQSKDPRVNCLSIDDLKHAGCLYEIPDNVRPACLNLDKGLKTESKKLDVYYDAMVKWGQALPRWERPCEAYSENPKRKEYPLQLIQTRTRFHIHNHFCDAEWIRQFTEPCIEMNPTDCAARQLETGDLVEVLNDRGMAKCRVKANSAIRPGTLRCHEGYWSKYMVEGNFQMLTNDEVNERGRDLIKGPVIPFNDTLVEVKKA